MLAACAQDPAVGGSSGDEDGESTRTEVSRDLVQNLGGEVTATFEGLTEDDGRPIALISIEADLETEGEGEVENEAGEMETHNVEFAMELEGELRWDLEAGHAAGFEVSGDVEVEMTVEGAFGGQTSRREIELSGSLLITLGIETEE